MTSLHGRLAVHRAPFVLLLEPDVPIRAPERLARPFMPVQCTGRAVRRAPGRARGVPESCAVGRSRAKEARAGAVGTDAVGHRRGRVHRLESSSPASTRPAAATSSSTTRSAPTASGATSASASSPTWCRPRDLFALARRPQARRRHPSRRDLRHHRDRRRSRDGQQFPPLAASCSTGARRRARRSSMLLRPRPMATATQGFDDDWSPAALQRLRPMNLYGWSKHLFDLAVVERVAKRREAAAAMGGAAILQRVRPERIPQGRDDEPGRQALRRRQGRQAGAAVQVAPRRHRRRRAEARFHLCRRRGRGGALAAGDAVGVRHLQCRHRQGAQLPRPDLGACSARSAARRTSNMSTCRPTIRDQYQYFTQAKVENLRRAGYNAGFTPLEDGGEPIRHVPEPARPLPVRQAGSVQRSRDVRLRRSAQARPSRPCSASAT